jgi:hypothetical protein
MTRGLLSIVRDRGLHILLRRNNQQSTGRDSDFLPVVSPAMAKNSVRLQKPGRATQRQM